MGSATPLVLADRRSASVSKHSHELGHRMREVDHVDFKSSCDPGFGSPIALSGRHARPDPPAETLSLTDGLHPQAPPALHVIYASGYSSTIAHL
nr:hypothetical protein CFP56_03682 [Quercus suber]